MTSIELTLAGLTTAIVRLGQRLVQRQRLALERLQPDDLFGPSALGRAYVPRIGAQGIAQGPQVAHGSIGHGAQLSGPAITPRQRIAARVEGSAVTLAFDLDLNAPLARGGLDRLRHQGLPVGESWGRFGGIACAEWGICCTLQPCPSSQVVDLCGKVLLTHYAAQCAGASNRHLKPAPILGSSHFWGEFLGPLAVIGQSLSPRCGHSRTGRAWDRHPKTRIRVSL